MKVGRGMLSALSIAVAAPAGAATIVDTGICDTGCIGLPFNTGIAGHTVSAAGIRFTTSQTFHLTSIAANFRGSGSGTFSVYSLTAGNLPDQELFSEGFTVAPGGIGFGTNSVALNAYLSPGSYALVAAPDDGVSTLMTQVGSASAAFTVYPSFAKVDGLWQGLPMSFMGKSVAFTLSGDAAPEPATWAMMIGGLGLVGVSLRRRTVGLIA